MSKNKSVVIKLPKKRGEDQGPVVVVKGRVGLPSDYHHDRIGGGSIGLKDLDRIERSLPSALKLAAQIMKHREASNSASSEAYKMAEEILAMENAIADKKSKLSQKRRQVDVENSKASPLREELGAKHDFVAGDYRVRFFEKSVGVGCRRVPYDKVKKYIAILRKAIKQTSRSK